jgi:dUTP pyrophosphatase
MKVKIKKLHPDAIIPKYAMDGDAAMDLTAVTKEIEHTYNGTQIKYTTGLSFEIPNGYVGLIFPRSSIKKTGMVLTNHVGVIDSGFRGDVTFFFTLNNGVSYNVGDRIGQIMIIPYPSIEFEEVEELSDTIRNTNGFGSSGK